MLDVIPVVLIDSLSVQQQFMQIIDVLLDNVSNILQLGKFMAVVLSEHALRTHYGVADFAKIFYFFVLMFETKNLSCNLICNCATSSIIQFIFIAISVFPIIVI